MRKLKEYVIDYRGQSACLFGFTHAWTQSIDLHSKLVTLVKSKSWWQNPCASHKQTQRKTLNKFAIFATNFGFLPDYHRKADLVNKSREIIIKVDDKGNFEKGVRLIHIR